MRPRPRARTIVFVTTTPAPTTRRRQRRDWPILTGLFLLALIPSLAGSVRVTQLASGVQRTPGNARFVDMPVPVIIHIIGAVLFAILGALQLAPRFRARHLRWHRWSGRVVLVSGLAVALSGLWMTAYYPLPYSDAPALNYARCLVGAGMLASLILAYATVRRRNFRAHRAWMLRAYALGMGAGTQVLTNIPLALTVHTSDPAYPSARAFAMIAAWVINLAVAEYLIRRRRTPRPALA